MAEEVSSSLQEEPGSAPGTHLSLQEELMFWGHRITPHRELSLLKYRLWCVLLSSRQPGTGGRLTSVSLHNNDSSEGSINTQSVPYYDNMKE